MQVIIGVWELHTLFNFKLFVYMSLHQPRFAKRVLICNSKLFKVALAWSIIYNSEFKVTLQAGLGLAGFRPMHLISDIFELIVINELFATFIVRWINGTYVSCNFII